MSRLPGLLLLHGVGDSGACWGPFVERLRAVDGGELADLVVSTPDAPAHGDSPATGHTLAAEDQIALATEHAVELAARTGGPIVLGGHSMGAVVALAVAARRPDLTCALWLEDPPFTSSLADNDAADPDEVADVSEIRDWFEFLQDRPLDTVIAMVRAEHPGWDQDEYEPWARAKQAVDTTAFRDPLGWVGSNWSANARSVAGPVVLVAGDPEAGGMIHPAAADELAALPGWSVHHLPTGHSVRREAPVEVVALLAGLIRSASA